MQEESIYNIIPKEYVPPTKGPLYRSKYAANIPPTGSTFGHMTTSKPGVSNLGGDYQVGLQAHTEYGATKTFGHVKGNRTSSPDRFLKKHTGTMGNQTLPPVRNFSYDCRHKKPQIPAKNQKPVMGLKSGKNFVVTNAVENILSTAKKLPEEQNWLKKKDFGKNPQYLSGVKQNVQNQYKMLQNLHQQQHQRKQCLTEEEVRELRQGLKRKWEEVNRQYQKITHIRHVDSLGLKNKKEGCEKELAEIEAHIKKLNKLYLFQQ